jgi:hypothetical protein
MKVARLEGGGCAGSVRVSDTSLDSVCLAAWRMMSEGMVHVVTLIKTGDDVIWIRIGDGVTLAKMDYLLQTN